MAYKKLLNFVIFLDGSLSDTAVGQLHGLEVPQKEPARKDSHRDRDRSNQFVGLNKKSNSTSQLSATGKSVKQSISNTPPDDDTSLYHSTKLSFVYLMSE